MSRIHDYPDAQAASRPEALALIDWDGRRLSYGDLKAESEALAAILTEAGVRPGHRVVILAENSAAAIAALFACSRLDAIAVPVNARQTAGEVDRILAHAEPSAVLATVEVSPNAAEHGQRLGASPIGMGLAMTTRQPGAPETGVAVMLYTTGTTGQPKGVMLTHGNLLFAGNASATIRGMRPTDIIYGALPMTHVFGLASMIMASSRAGAAIRLAPRFSAEALYSALREDVTVLPAVPQMHALLMDYTRAQGHDSLQGGQLRYVSSGAAPLDPEWKRKAEMFYGIPLQNGYGMTESTAGISTTSNRIGDPDISVGHPLDGVEVRIDETVEGGGNGEGEVLTRGPHVMKGYFRNPKETARVLTPDGWLRTGDVGRIDTGGRLHILGRSKELIIHGGFNVYPVEVEAALNEHPAVVQSAVIGRKADGDEEVWAFVQPTAPDATDEATLKAFVRDRLTGYKRPARIVLMDRLPAAPTGKVLKHKLQDHLP